MNYQDGELRNITFFLEDTINEKINIVSNVKRINKIFFESDKKFIKIHRKIDNYQIQNIINNINKCNEVFLGEDFYLNVESYSYSDNLIQIMDKVNPVSPEYGDGEWDSESYFHDYLIDKCYLKTIKSISKKIWERGFIHPEIIKSIAENDEKILKVYDIECIVDIETFKNSFSLHKVRESICEHDVIFSKIFYNYFNK